VYRLGDGNGCWFGQQPQQQHLQPEPRLDALAQLLFAAPQLALPAQQPITAEPLGQLKQLGPVLGGKAAQFGPIRGGYGQHQIAQQGGQPLEHRGRFAAAVKQQAAGLDQLQGLKGSQSHAQVEQFLLRHGPEQLPDRPTSIGAGNRLSWSSRLSASLSPPWARCATTCRASGVMPICSCSAM